MTPPRIFVVDDEPAILRSVERVLSPPYQVACTHSPREAVGLAARLGQTWSYSTSACRTWMGLNSWAESGPPGQIWRSF